MRRKPPLSIVGSQATRQAVETVWRIESPRLIGGLLRLVRELQLAEDLAQEALLVALERWPTTGIPQNPAAWLMTTAKNRALDQLRQKKMQQRKQDRIAQDTSALPEPLPDSAATLDEELDDDLLRLIFIACHPVLPQEGRAALTLRLLGGLTTGEIARAFLVSEATMAQRIVRAKRTLGEAHVPFETPRGPQLQARLSSVLEAIYLIFNEGYAATRGEDWTRPELCQEALRLGRMLAQLMPVQAEVHGLTALMELHASRLPARIGAAGEPILLLEQDRSRWDQLLLQRGLAALARAESLSAPLGPYALQAAIAACHARARNAADTDWARIVALYDALAQLTLSPVVELNRAVAVSMAFGADAGLQLVEALAAEPALRSYHLLPSVRGDLLAKLARHAEAAAQFERAASMTQNARERALLLARARESRGHQRA